MMKRKTFGYIGFLHGRRQGMKHRQQHLFITKNDGSALGIGRKMTVKP